MASYNTGRFVDPTTVLKNDCDDYDYDYAASRPNKLTMTYNDVFTFES